jgi:hypothetical protein
LNTYIATWLRALTSNPSGDSAINAAPSLHLSRSLAGYFERALRRPLTLLFESMHDASR